MNRKIQCITSLLAFSILASMTACTSTPEPEAPARLTNHMTAAELAAASETTFQLLDKPWEAYETEEDTTYDYLMDKVCLGETYGAIVYGTPCYNALPPKDYDGGAGTVCFLHTELSTGDITQTEIDFEDYEDLKVKLRAEFDADIAAGYQGPVADKEYEDLITLYDAVIAGETMSISEAVMHGYSEYYFQHGTVSSDSSMYWEFDDAPVEEIKDLVHEYHLYDEELDLNFVVHVITPPSYDPEKAYPALVMTDAVWRFKDVPPLYDRMNDGGADPQYLITIGFEYNIDGWDNEVRGNILCDHKKEFLDFITDNMMPYLNTTYLFDDNCTLMGHSQGGVFTHYAAFNYDRYENQPFRNYIIASPAFWSPYFVDVSDYNEFQDEYGYFGRNSTYDRNIYIAGGSMEDVDYAEYYGCNDSTLTGIAHLCERLDGHGITYHSKLYNSHHFQYVSQMLVEYATGNF